MSVFGSLVLSLLLACGDETEVVEEVAQDIVTPQATPEKSKRDVLKEFKLQLGQGRIADAQQTLSTLQGDTAAASFHLAGAIGWSGGDLSVATELGHGDWANLIAGNPQVAYDTSSSAGMKALSVVRGAKSGLVAEWEASKPKKRSKTPVEERTWSADEALELLVATNDVSFLDSAKAVTDWAGQLALAEWAKSQGQADVATEAFANAAAIDGFGQLYASARHATETKDVATLTDTIGKASGIGDVVAGISAIDGLIAVHLENGDLPSLWKDAYDSLKGEHKMKLADASWEILALTRVGLLTGHTGDVREQVQKLIAQSEGAVLTEANLYAGLVGMRMLDKELLASVKEKDSDASLGVLLQSGTGIENLPVEQQYLVASTLAPRSGTFASTKLTEVLKQKMPSILRLHLTMLQLDWLQSSKQDTSAILETLAKSYADKPNLQMELSIRAAVNDFSAPIAITSAKASTATTTESKDQEGQKEAKDETTSSVTETLWSQIATGKNKKVDVQTRAEKGLAAYAKLLSANRTGKSMDTVLDDVWQNAPLHRVGVLSTHTALDFSDGGDFVGLFRSLIGVDGDGQTMASVGLLELARTVQDNNQRGFEGRSPIFSLSDEERRPLMTATETLRADVLSFWMGGDFPTKALNALSEAEKTVMNLPKNAHLYHNTLIGGRSIREKMRAISSVTEIFEDDGQYLAGVLAPNASSALILGSASAVNKQVAKHRAALIAGLKDTKINHLPGNDLRAMVIQPLLNVSMGVSKFLLIVPPEMAQFGFSTLPEQKEGLRFFGHTPRDITLSTSLDAMWSGIQSYTDYTVDMLAFSRPTEEEKWQSSVIDADNSTLLTNQGFSAEVGLIKVHFSDSVKVFIREEATVATFIKEAPEARYIYLSETPSTESGGFEMADGELTLDQITALKLHAMIVFLGPDTDITRQAKRVEAFMQAGAQAVIVQSWAIPSNDLRVLVENMFMNLKRNDPLLLALKKTRKKYIKEQSKDAYENNPAMWGAFTVYSTP